MRISLEGVVAEPGLDVWALVGAATALDRIHYAAVRDGVLNILFEGVGGSRPPMISAIEVRYFGPIGGPLPSVIQLTDAGGVEAGSARIGGRVYVFLPDADQNTQPGLPDTVTVVAQDASTGDLETLALMETAADTGLFRGSLSLSSALGQEVNDGILRTAGGNTVSVCYTDPNDSPIDYRCDTVTALSAGSADIRVTVSVNDATPDEGQSVILNVKVKNNNGPDVATNLVAVASAPMGMEYLSGTAASGVYDVASGLWSIGSLASGVEVALTINARVTAGSGQSVVATAALQAVDQVERSPGNESDSVTLTVNPADVQVTAAADDTTPDEGQLVRLTISAKNTGPASLASGIVVSDVLPTEVTLVTASAGQGSYDATSGIWTVGSLASGATASLFLDVQPNAGTSGRSITDVARLHALDQMDPNPGNNAAAVVLYVNAAGVQVSMSVSDSTPDEGQTIAFTVKVKNGGPAFASGIVISDVLPSTLELVSVSVEQGSYDSATGLWTVGALANGVFKQLMLTVKPRAGTSGQTIVNTATLVALDQADTTTADNTAGAAVLVNGVDMDVAASVNDPLPGEGQTIAVCSVRWKQRAGHGRFRHRRERTLPAGVTYVSATAVQGSFDPMTGIWTVGSLAKDATAGWSSPPRSTPAPSGKRRCSAPRRSRWINSKRMPGTTQTASACGSAGWI